MTIKNIFLKKGILLIIVIICSQSFLFATNGTWTGEDYSLFLSYNKKVQPGDAIFLRLCLTPLTHSLRSKRGTCTGKIELYTGEWQGSAELESADDTGGDSICTNSSSTKTTETQPHTGHEKKMTSAVFYNLSQNSPNDSKAQYDTLLAGIPLSSYCKPGNYTLTVTYTPFSLPAVKFTLPVVVEPKEFNSETIPLDASNTAIKTDSSTKRLSQINRLNQILSAVDTDAVYETSAFTPPTDSVRRTAFFADRRVYAYSNGKSSTSLHFGTDYGVPVGTPVKSCGAGKVVMAENRVSTGWSVCIEHLPGLYSLYYHMDSLEVTEGQIVTHGQLIGHSGCTGLATGPHLHWEMRLNMEAVNPDFFTNDFTSASMKVPRPNR